MATMVQMSLCAIDQSGASVPACKCRYSVLTLTCCLFGKYGPILESLTLGPCVSESDAMGARLPPRRAAGRPHLDRDAVKRGRVNRGSSILLFSNAVKKSVYFFQFSIKMFVVF